jgi:hypothetical protein
MARPELSYGPQSVYPPARQSADPRACGTGQSVHPSCAGSTGLDVALYAGQTPCPFAHICIATLWTVPYATPTCRRTHFLPAPRLFLSVLAYRTHGLALTGLFAQKPAILFCLSDFHHISASVPRDGIEHAFAAPPPDSMTFSAYLHWFFGDHAVNAGVPDAARRLNARLRQHGWPVAELPSRLDLPRAKAQVCAQTLRPRSEHACPFPKPAAGRLNIRTS